MGLLADTMEAMGVPRPPQALTDPPALDPQFQSFVYVSLVCLDRLARLVAAATDLTYADAFERLGAIPDRFADNMESAQGWARMAVHITGEPVSPITVTVH